MFDKTTAINSTCDNINTTTLYKQLRENNGRDTETS